MDNLEPNAELRGAGCGGRRRRRGEGRRGKKRGRIYEGGKQVVGLAVSSNANPPVHPVLISSCSFFATFFYFSFSIARNAGREIRTNATLFLS